ncbi:hypothetical protein Tco_0232554 [Tanacetum coccineum]
MQETTEKIFQIKDRLKAVRDRQKSYADKCRKPLEFNVGDHVLLKVSPWKGVVRFRKKSKLAPRIVHTKRGDDVPGSKPRHRDLSSDGVEDLMTPLKHNRLKSDLEYSTW